MILRLNLARLTKQMKTKIVLLTTLCTAVLDQVGLVIDVMGWVGLDAVRWTLINVGYTSLRFANYTTTTGLLGTHN